MNTYLSLFCLQLASCYYQYTKQDERITSYFMLRTPILLLGPLSSSLGPLVSSLGPLSLSLGPLVSSLGPLVSSLGPLVSSLGPRASISYVELHIISF